MHHIIITCFGAVKQEFAVKGFLSAISINCIKMEKSTFHLYKK